MKRSGPARVISFHCHGCSHLVTEEWLYEDEDHCIETGCDARCTKAEKIISTYWSRRDHAPDWCPLLPSARPSATPPREGSDYQMEVAAE